MRVRVLRILDLSDRRTCLQSDFAPLGCKQCALGNRGSTNRLEGTVLRGLLVVSHLLTSFRCGGVGELTPLAALSLYWGSMISTAPKPSSRPASGVLLATGCASTPVTPTPESLGYPDPRRPSHPASSSSLLADAQVGSRPLDRWRRCQAAVGLHTPQPAIRSLEDRRAVTRNEELVVWRQLAQALKLAGREQHVHAVTFSPRTAPSRRSRICSEEIKSSRCSGATSSA